MALCVCTFPNIRRSIYEHPRSHFCTRLCSFWGLLASNRRNDCNERISLFQDPQSTLKSKTRGYSASLAIKSQFRWSFNKFIGENENDWKTFLGLRVVIIVTCFFSAPRTTSILEIAWSAIIAGVLGTALRSCHNHQHHPNLGNVHPLILFPRLSLMLYFTVYLGLFNIPCFPSYKIYSSAYLHCIPQGFL